MPNDLIKAATGSLSSLTSEIYRDLVHPSAARVGLSLEALIKVSLTPISLLDWGFEQSKQWLQERILERLSKTPSEYVVQPKSNVVSAALQRIATSHDTPELRDLYAELLLKAMDSRTTNNVHPAFFSIVEQLAPSEALVLVALHETGKEELFAESFNGYSLPEKSASIEQQFRLFCEATLGAPATQSNVWLKNLCRLGVIERHVSNEAIFRPEDGDRHGVHPARVDNVEHQALTFTEFGADFIAACAPVNGRGLSIKSHV
jgi:Abortive infection alpha